jgi:hypothetical protein
MQMILIKANLLHLLARHTSQQLRQKLSDVTAHSRIQDPATVFTYPDSMVVEIVNTVSCFDIFHGGIIQPPGSFIHG